MREQRGNEERSAPRPAPALHRAAHKGEAGRVLAFCGSEFMPGAAILVLRAAQRAGAGLVCLACTHRELSRVVPAAVPEATYTDLSGLNAPRDGRLPAGLRARQDDVRVAGPGLGAGPQTAHLVRALVLDDFAGPLVLDADALPVLEDATEVTSVYEAPLVLTPHPGEAARLLGLPSIPGETEGRIECALEICRRSGGICCLKGEQTVIASGKGFWINTSGNQGMATAGAGDVLVGILGAYLASAARGIDPDWGVLDAVRAAVYVHGLAGDLAAAELGQRAVIASDLIDFLPAAQLKFAAS